jgi:branched-chain amino acid aminotransferase
LSPKIKVGANYINSRLGLMEAKRNGYDSTIFLNRSGQISEGPGSCLFFSRSGKWITPSLSASILESITRQTALTIAEKELGVAVRERDVDRTELYIADEAFLCGTAVEILPILSVDRINLGSGGLGPLTRSLQDAYFRIVRGQDDIYRSWLTPVYA